MAEEKKVHKYPVGTIREWEKGDVIKAHDNSAFDSGWMLIPDTPPWLLELMLNMDLTGRAITSAKTPIDGELWLKKLITEFKAPSGHKYTLEEFQQYKGLFGASGYSFRNVFSKRYYNEKIDLREQIDKALMNANESRWHQLRDEDPSKYLDYHDKTIYISKEQIAKIKERVKANFKGRGDNLDPRDIKELSGLLTKVNDYLKKGTNLEGEEKEVYDRNNAIKNNFTNDYLPLKEKRAAMHAAVDEINEKFGDNWGIKESFRKQFQEQYNLYVHINMQKIKKDELSNFQAELGCDISAPIDEFYKCLTKLQDKYVIDLHDYVGKNVPNPLDKYQDVKLISADPVRYIDSEGREGGYYQKNAAKSIKKMLASREVGDMQLPLQIRFDQLYNKNIDGPWDFDEAIALKAMEQVFNFLPPGHCLTNDLLKTFEKDNGMSSSAGYACYKPKQSLIYMSDKALNEASRMTDLNSGDEFASVIIHEIGHAVEKKVGLRKSLAYKKFGYEAGWNWDLYRGRSVFATGDDKDIPRNSTHGQHPLITKYAQKSPSEAFAEYYSFYNQYKTEIDQMLDHKDHKGLVKHQDVKVPKGHADGETPDMNYSSYINSATDSQHLHDGMTAVLLAQQRDLSEHFTSDIIDPWEVTKAPTLKSNLDKRTMRKVLELNRGQKQSIPVFSVKSAQGVHQLSDETEMHVNEANKYLKNYTPTYSCSQEAYNILKGSGYSDQAISNFTLHQVKDEPVPYVSKEHGLDFIHGLRYRSKVVPAETIIKNQEIFREMRNIYYSDALKKALEDLLNDDNENINVVEKSDSGSTISMPTGEPVTKQSLISLFKKHIINPIAKSLGGLMSPSDLAETLAGEVVKTNGKKQYADAIILDENGRILLLKRNEGDGFEPGKWCLPGGNVEPKEDKIITATRELKEETNLECELQYVGSHETDNALIDYHFGRCELNAPVIIDSAEHCDYTWCNLTDLEQYDLLLDLGDQLKQIFDLKSETAITLPEPEKKFGDIEELTFEKAFELIAKSYDEGKITDEQFFDALRKYELVKTNNLSVDEKFEKGLITEEDLFKAIKSKPVEQPEEDDEGEDEDPMDEGPGGDDGNDPAPGEDDEPAAEDNEQPEGGSDDTHAPTGLSMDKLKQYAMTTGQEQLENFIKHSKDPELRKIAHDELARRQDDEHPQEDDDSPSGGDKPDKKSGDSKPAKKPSNAKESLESAQAPTEKPEEKPEGPDKADIHSDPDYEDKAGQYAQAIASGQDPTTNPFLADFANHIEEKKKGFKPLDLTVEVPDADDLPNTEADDDQPNVEANDEQAPESKATSKKEDNKK